MPGILEEFAYGNVPPQAQVFEKDSRYGKAVELAARIERKLLDRLGAEDQALFERYADAQSEVKQLTAVENFVRGYRLGLMMTAEAFVGMEDLYIGGEDI